MGHQSTKLIDFCVLIEAIEALTSFGTTSPLYKRQTAYVAVAPNFPECQTGDLDILTASNKLLEAVDYIKREIGKGNVDRGKASRAEKSALDAYDLILPFCEVMSQRIIVFESYEKTIENFQILKNFEVNMQVLNLQINYVTTEDEIDTCPVTCGGNRGKAQ